MLGALGGRNRKNGWRITGNNFGDIRKIEKKGFQKVKSVVDERIDKVVKRRSRKRKIIQGLFKRIKKSKD